jgi:hypothetical protein
LLQRRPHPTANLTSQFAYGLSSRAKSERRLYNTSDKLQEATKNQKQPQIYADETDLKKNQVAELWRFLSFQIRVIRVNLRLSFFRSAYLSRYI